MQIQDFDPTWNNDLIVGSLVAQSLYRLRIIDGRVVFSEQIKVGHRVRYVHQFNDKSIVLWTDENKLVLLRKTEQPAASVALEELVNKMNLNEVRKKKLISDLNTCSQCHSVAIGDDAKAPNLGDVFGRRIASTGFTEYSQSLKSVSGNWNEFELRQYLTEPSAFAAETSMPDTNLPKESVSDLISALRKLSDPE